MDTLIDRLDGLTISARLPNGPSKYQDRSHLSHLASPSKDRLVKSLPRRATALPQQPSSISSSSVTGASSASHRNVKNSGNGHTTSPSSDPSSDPAMRNVPTAPRAFADRVQTIVAPATPSGPRKATEVKPTTSTRSDGKHLWLQLRSSLPPVVHALDQRKAGASDADVSWLLASSNTSAVGISVSACDGAEATLYLSRGHRILLLPLRRTQPFPPRLRALLSSASSTPLVFSLDGHISVLTIALFHPTYDIHVLDLAGHSHPQCPQAIKAKFTAGFYIPPTLRERIFTTEVRRYQSDCSHPGGVCDCIPLSYKGGSVAFSRDSYAGSVIGTAVMSNAAELQCLTRLSTLHVNSDTIGLFSKLATVDNRVLRSAPRSREANFSLTVQGGIPGKKYEPASGAEVYNERFATRARRSRQQVVVAKVRGTDRTEAFYVSSTNGRSVMLSRTKSSAVKDQVSSDQLEGFTLVGSDELTAEDISKRQFYRDVLDAAATFDPDPSQLLAMISSGRESTWQPKRRARWALQTPDLLQNDTLCKSARILLNPTQRAAALDIMTAGGGKSRTTLVQGPPGSGKTSVIGAIARQWDEWNLKGKLDNETMYIACQSNIAIRNVANKLQELDVSFRLLVSREFYHDWHEDLYEKLEEEGKFVRTDTLPESESECLRMLGDAQVILCTVATLSSPRLCSGTVPLFRLRELRLLLVDEASQLSMSTYPHLFQRFYQSLDHVAFFGDDCQLAPHGSGSDNNPVNDVPSIFEQPLVRARAHFLDTSYRLPTTLASFISKAMYDGKLKSGPNVLDAPIEQVVAYVDVADGVTEKGGTSFKNMREVQTIVKLVQHYVQNYPSKNFCVLTTYTAQRDVLQRALMAAKLPWEGKCFTVDAFQGNEAPVVLISLVRDCRLGGVGFLSNRRRTNVLLSRTKSAMVVVSSRRFLSESTAKSTLAGQLADLVPDSAWVTANAVLNHTAKLPVPMRS